MKNIKFIIVFAFCILFTLYQANATKHNITICDSSKLELSVTPQGVGTFSYQWYHSSSAITGATADTYTDNQAIASADEGNYYCIITDGNNCTQSSDTIVVTIKSQPRIVQSDFYLCENMSDTLTLYNSYTGGSWSVAGSPNSTISSAGIIHTNGLDDKVTFYYTDTHSGACTCRDSVTVTVINKPSVTVSPNSLTICEGGSTDMVATGTSDPATTPSYQWFATSSDWSTRNSNLGTSATQNTGTLNISGTTSDSTYYYLVEVSNTSTNGGCPKDTARAQVLVRVTPDVSIASVLPVCEAGGSATLTATASTATYNWYACTSAGATLGSSLGTSSTQSISSFDIAGHTADSVFYYKVIVQNTNGSTCPKDSATIGVTVYVTPTVTITPDVTAICENGTINLSSTVSITSNNTYQWYTTDAAGTTESSTLGTSNAQTYLTNVSGNTDTLVYFKLAVQHQGCTAVISNIAKDTVHPRPELNTISDITICSGDNCTYTFTGNIPTGTTYSWVIGTDNDNITGQAAGSGSSFLTADLFNSSTSTQNSLVYTITPKSAANCTAASTSSLTVKVQPSIKSKIYVNGVEQ